LKPLAVLAALISLILISSCANLDKRLKAAAETTGTVNAGVNLPLLPDDCRATEPHAALSAGVELRSVLKRERGALDRANARTGRCAGFYDDTREKFR
jgi:hypothetical protein